MIKVIKNGTVVTMDLKREKKYEKLDVVIKDNKIIDLCPNYTGQYDLIIDASEKIVMPGLINTHTHLGMSIFRATNDNLSLTEWLENMIWPIEDTLTNEETYYSTMHSLIEMLKTGTTTSNDMYFNCDGSLKAIKDTKTRVMFTRCLTDNDNNGDKKIEEFLKLYENNKENELITFSVAPHAMYTCSFDYLKKCSKLAHELKLPVHMHFCENLNEVDGIKNKYQKSPVEVLEETGLINNKLILAHATFVLEDLEKLKGKDISFSHNPISNLNLGCGIADITKYKDYVNICLGTDGQGSGNNLNMFYHMSLVDLLQKGLYKNPKVSSSYEVLKMATINGAKALGMDNLIGSIEVGKLADIIILDMNNILTIPNVDLINNICHNTLPNNVETTIVNGEILIHEHKLMLNINEELLKQKISLIANKISN